MLPIRIAACVGVGAMCFVSCSLPGGAEFASAPAEAGRAGAAKVDGNALKPHVEEIVRGRGAETPLASKYEPYDPLTHLNSARYVADAFRKIGLAPIEETFGPPEVAGTNVFVDLPGDSPEVVLVTGHHDAWFQQGADDNATAIAVMLEAARAINGTPLRRKIRFLAFDREEEGTIGAADYVRRHAGEKHRIVINMDCVGYFSRESGSQDAPPGFALRDTGDFVAVIANEAAHDDASRVVRFAATIPRPVDALGLLAPGNGGYPGTGDFGRSDHLAFWIEGIPAIFVTDTANFRNHNYHTVDDTPEKLDYGFMHSVAQLVTGAALAFSMEP